MLAAMFAFNPLRLLSREGKLSLDSSGANVFVSHAHADHACVSRRTVKLMASDATVDLLKARGYPVKGERWDNGFELLDAGHVLGSKQLRAELDGHVLTYAPDFKLEDSLTAGGAEVKECDELVVDATFASPEWVFPARQQVYEEIAGWTKKEQARGRIVVLGGYALGKAQELVACLNEFAGVTPLVGEGVREVCEVYEKHGVRLDWLSAESPEGAEELKTAFVAVVPFNKASPELAERLQGMYGKRVSLAVATGWALRHRFRVQAFPLSDHADHAQLKEFVERTGAKKVFSDKGDELVDGQPLSSRAQQSLLNW